MKDFLRFHSAKSHPQIEKHRPIADAICTVGEWFFAGFTRVSGTDTEAEDQERGGFCKIMLPLSRCLVLALERKSIDIFEWVRRTFGSRRRPGQQAPTET